MSQDRYGRGKRTSIPTPAIQQHREEIKAREDRREAYKRARNIRGDSPCPDHSQREGRNQEDSLRHHKVTMNGYELDDTARELLADEQRCRDLIAKICERDGRDDIDYLDEDELQRIWDEGEARRKSSTLFSKGSKVKDMGPAHAAISSSAPAHNPHHRKPSGSRKRDHSPDNSDAEGKRARSKHDRSLGERDFTKKSPRKAQNTKSLGTKALRPKYSSPARSSTSNARYKPAHRPAPSSSAKTYATTKSGRSHAGSSPSRRLSPALSQRARSRASSDASSPVHSRALSRASSRISEEDGRMRRDGGEESEEEEESDIDPDSDTEQQGHNSKDKDKSKKKRDRGTMSEFVGVERDLLDMTVALVCARLAAKGMFPTPQRYMHIIIKAWDNSAQELNLKSSRYKLTKRHLQAIRGCVNSFRGRMRDRIKTGLAQSYGLWGKGVTRQDVSKRVKELCPHGLHKLPGAKPGTGHFQHEFVEYAVYEAYFTGTAPIGAQFRKIFDPLPMRALAVVCAIIWFLVDEYATGKHTKKRMRFDDLKAKYLTYYSSLKTFARKQPERYELVMDALYKNSMALGGFAIDESESEPSDTDDILGDADFAEDIPTAEELTKLRRPGPRDRFPSEERSQELEDAEGQQGDIGPRFGGQPATPNGVGEHEEAADTSTTPARGATARDMAVDGQNGRTAAAELHKAMPKDRQLAKQVPTKGGLSVVLKASSSKGKSPAQAFARGGLKIKKSTANNSQYETPARQN